MLKQMNLTIFIISVTFGAIPEHHVRVGQIGLSADRTFMPCHLLGLSSRLKAGGFISGSLSLPVASVELIMTPDLLGGNCNTLDICYVENQAVDHRGKHRKSCVRAAYDQHIYHIDDINDAKPLHLDGNEKIEPDNIVGIGHCKNKIYGNIDIICAECKPDISSEKISGLLICIHNGSAFRQIQKCKICKGKKHCQKDTREYENIVFIGPPRSFKNSTYGITAPEHQYHKKDIILVRRYDQPCYKSPDLSVKYLIGVKGKIVQKSAVDHLDYISYRISQNEPHGQIGNNIFSESVFKIAQSKKSP